MLPHCQKEYNPSSGSCSFMEFFIVKPGAHKTSLLHAVGRHQ